MDDHHHIITAQQIICTYLLKLWCDVERQWRARLETQTREPREAYLGSGGIYYSTCLLTRLANSHRAITLSNGIGLKIIIIITSLSPCDVERGATGARSGARYSLFASAVSRPDRATVQAHTGHDGTNPLPPPTVHPVFGGQPLQVSVSSCHRAATARHGAGTAGTDIGWLTAGYWLLAIGGCIASSNDKPGER